MEDVWKIVLDNYKGESYIMYFKNYEIAKKNFDRLQDLNKDMPEFQISTIGTYMSWYDSNYDEYSTYIYLSQGAPKIYDKIVF